MTDYRISCPSSNSIGFKKRDDAGKESTFILYILPEYDGAEKLTPFIVVDSDLKEEKKFLRTIEPDAKKVIYEFHKWGPDAPLDYAHKIGDHLGRYFRVASVEEEKSIEAEAGSSGVRVGGQYKKSKKLMAKKKT